MTWLQPTAQYGQIDSVASRPVIRAPAWCVLSETAAGPRPQSATRPTRGRSRSLRKGSWSDDTVRSRVDVHARAAREAAEGEVAVRGEGHRERGGRADAHEDRGPGDRRLLHELER